MKLTERFKGLSTGKKVAIVTVAVVLVGGIGGTAYAQAQSRQKMLQAQEQVKGATSELKSLDKSFTALLDTKDSNFLAKDVKEEQLRKLQKQLLQEKQSFNNQYLSEKEKTDFYKQLEITKKTEEKVLKAFKTQTEINRLYMGTNPKKAMNGTEIDKNLVIADGLNRETLDTVKKDYYKKDSKIPYEKTVNELITIAEDQLNQIDKAKNEVAKVYKDNKVVSTDAKLYDTAKSETDKIKNGKAKKELNDQLAKVKTDIDKKAKEEADKKPSDTANQTESGKFAEQSATTAQQEPSNTATANTGNETVGGYSGGGTATGDQGGYASGGTATDNGGGYTPPATDTNAQQPTTPPATNDNNTINVNPNDVQGSEANNTGGSNEWWGW